MWIKGFSQFVVFLFAAPGLCSLSGEYQECDVSFSVDSTAIYQDWRQQYVENGQSLNETLKINFSSFQEALSALNFTEFDRANTSCVEVLVSGGSYTVTSEIKIERNVRIVAKGSDRVFVSFNVFSSNPERVFNVITFINADFVILRGLHFFNSTGIITIEKIAYVHVSQCRFK